MAALVSHLGGLAAAFTAAASKQFGEVTDTAPEIDENLDHQWRTDYPRLLTHLALAWADPGAWSGMSRIGGVDLPADVCGLVALTEVVVHGWDLARAIDVTYTADSGYAGDPANPGDPADPADPATDELLNAVLSHVTAFTEQGPVEGLFAAPIPVASEAPLLDRVIALTGRDPRWSR